MSRSSTAARAHATVMIASAIALSLLAPWSHAQSGPFADLAGSWSGNGTIGMSNGERERIRCRASYAVGAGGDSLRQSLRCASDSYSFDLASNVTHSAGAIYGSWSEATRGVRGELSGTARGSDIRARADGPSFAANLALSTRGDRQAVTIRATGGDITEVSITLSRR
jgi:hypothetical protein